MYRPTLIAIISTILANAVTFVYALKSTSIRLRATNITDVVCGQIYNNPTDWVTIYPNITTNFDTKGRPMCSDQPSGREGGLHFTGIWNQNCGVCITWSDQSCGEDGGYITALDFSRDEIREIEESGSYICV